MNSYGADTDMPVRPTCKNLRFKDEEVAAAAATGAEWEVVQDTPIMTGDDDIEVEIDDHDDEHVEIEDVKIGKDPKLPLPSEIEEHRTAGHVDFRDWCIHCQLGRGLGPPHKAPEGERRVAVLSMDYFFITAGGVVAPGDDGLSQPELEQQVEAETAVKCLAMRDSMSGALFAWIIPKKGKDDFVVSRVVQAVEWLGYKNIYLKSDNEPAIRGLIKQALRLVKVECDCDETKTEHSAPHESQSNGGVENAVRNVRRLLRTIKSCIEERLNTIIEPNHPIMEWMLPYTAAMITIMRKKSDGRTPWSKVKGRAFNRELVGFGETCLYKLPMKGPRAIQRGNIANVMNRGIFVGWQMDTNEYVIATKDGIARARGVRRLPLANRWDRDGIAGIRATPQNQFVVPETKAVFPEVEVQRQPAGADDRPKVRRLKITADLLRQYGYSDNCDQCEFIQRHGMGRPGQQHAEACRQRVMDDMAKTPDGQKRFGDLEKRVDRALADYVEDHVAKGEHEVASVPMVMRSSEASGHAPLDYPEGDTGGGPEYAMRRNESDGQEVASSSAHGDPVDPSPDGDPGPASPGDQEMGVDQTENGHDMDLTHVDDEVLCHVDDEVLCLVQQLGVCPGQYKREQKRGMRALISEVYSPPRVTKLINGLPSLGLAPGFALDLTVIDEYDGLP